MKKYLNSFIVNYEVYGERIAIYLENNKSIIIPYTKEDEINILKKMKKQIKERDQTYIKYVSAKTSLYLIFITFIPLILAFLITFGICSLTLIVTCLGILSTLIETKDLNVYKSRLNEINKLNKKYTNIDEINKDNNFYKEFEFINDLDVILEDKNYDNTPRLIKKINKM